MEREKNLLVKLSFQILMIREVLEIALVLMKLWDKIASCASSLLGLGPILFAFANFMCSSIRSITYGGGGWEKRVKGRKGKGEGQGKSERGKGVKGKGQGKSERAKGGI